jgi:hypothetical protein
MLSSPTTADALSDADLPGIGRVVLNAPLTTRRVLQVRGGLRTAAPYLIVGAGFDQADSVETRTICAQCSALDFMVRYGESRAAWLIEPIHD